MAYGRDAQAEEILKDALAKDSTRQAIRVKLLEIYANRKDARSFETAANELRAATGGRGAEWEKVAALGLSIDPTNALYGGKQSSAPLGINETGQMPAFSMNTQPTLEPAAPLNIDFDIGTATTGGPAPLPDLDLGIGSASSSQSVAGLAFSLRPCAGTASPFPRAASSARPRGSPA